MYFLGFEIQTDLNRIVKISQLTYAKKVLAKFGMIVNLFRHRLSKTLNKKERIKKAKMRDLTIEIFNVNDVWYSTSLIIQVSKND